MTTRVTFEGSTGRYDVHLDGEWLGWVWHQPPNGWVPTPVLATPAPDAEGTPENRSRHRATRSDAAKWLLMREGIPQSIAAILMYGWDVPADDEHWITAVHDRHDRGVPD